MITHITREEFSFGRSLNLGCEAAQGEVLILISGHCVPRDRHWLRALCQPIIDGLVDYSYGKQIGGPESRYSECRIFAKYFPDQSSLPQEGFFRSEEHTSELQSLMRISYAVFCLKKKKISLNIITTTS